MFSLIPAKICNLNKNFYEFFLEWQTDIGFYIENQHPE